MPWTLLIRPALLAHGDLLAMQVVTIIVVMSLMTIMGALIRVTATTRRGRASLSYLFVAIACSLIAVTLSTTILDRYGNHPRWIDPVWFVAYFALTAAMLHPSSAYLTTGEGEHPDDMSARALFGAGLVLSLNPLISIAMPLMGRSPDVPLMAVSALISVPLLLVRFWHLGMQRLKAEQALAYRAAHDELTGLPNRRTILERVDVALGALAAGRIDAVAVLFFDLDGFKPINDDHGHQVGDQVLRIVGQRLQRCVRSSDVVGRLGGDEFLIMCAGLDGRLVSELVARMRAALGEPIVIGGLACAVDASVGIAMTTRDDDVSAEALVARADQAMYAVKRARDKPIGTTNAS